MQKKKQLVGSMALRSQLEAIPENYELSNDSLLIISYISLLVLNQKFGDTIRAIEIVNCSQPADPLLKANLSKLNALALMHSEAETGKFHHKVSVNHAFRMFENANSLFEKIGLKLSNNEANLGRAVCLYGMAMIMLRNPFNFTNENMDEDQCLRHVLSLLESALEIYKRRRHYGGAAHCISNLQIVKKKLAQPFLYLNEESKKLRKLQREWKEVVTQTGKADRVPKECIYRHDGWEISLLIEIVDSYQLQTPTQILKRPITKTSARRPLVSAVKRDNLRTSTTTAAPTASTMASASATTTALRKNKAPESKLSTKPAVNMLSKKAFSPLTPIEQD